MGWIHDPCLYHLPGGDWLNGQPVCCTQVQQKGFDQRRVSRGGSNIDTEAPIKCRCSLAVGTWSSASCPTLTYWVGSALNVQGSALSPGTPRRRVAVVTGKGPVGYVVSPGILPTCTRPLPALPPPHPWFHTPLYVTCPLQRSGGQVEQARVRIPSR